MKPSDGHPAGKALASDWSTDSYIKVVYVIFFQAQSRIFCPRHNQKYSHRQPMLNIFTNQSEVSALPTKAGNKMCLSTINCTDCKNKCICINQ